jgi:hypothetical protein
LATLSRLLPVALCLAFGCAETRVNADSDVQLPMLARPDRIIVHDFAATPADLSTDSAMGAREDLSDPDESAKPADEQQAHAEKARVQIGEETANVLSDKLVELIREMGLPAERAEADAPDPEVQGDEVIISIHGQFLHIKKGHMVERIVIGLGVGHSEVDCEVQAYALVSDGSVRYSQFGVRARSGHKPGLLETLPIGAAVIGPGVVMAGAAGADAGTDVMATIHADAKRTAKIVAGYLGGRFYREGWVTREEAKKAGVAVGKAAN